MPAATIVFTDLVGFSKKPTAEQKRLVESMTSEVLHELRPLLTPPLGAPSVVALPTGDGLALAFLHQVDQPWTHATILGLVLRLHRWAYGVSRSNALASIRIGVHVGAVELLTDINGHANLCGDTINFAQRVMDAANPRQTLYSEAAFREYVGSESPSIATSPFSDEFRASFSGPVEVYAKHGLHMLVYPLLLEPAQAYWSNDEPVAKHLMLVSLTPLPKEIVGTFSEQVSRASSIALVQLTGDRFVDLCNDGRIRFSHNLRRFWVFMPEPAVYAGFHLTSPEGTAQLVSTCVEKWLALFSKLKRQYRTADFKLGLFQEPPYFGASYLDWERPGGMIHVSPYVWNVAARDCPGYCVSWIGKTPSVIYERYVEGLDYLNRVTANAIPVE